MDTKPDRRRARMMLGSWGRWKERLDGLEKELAAAREWIARADDDALYKNARVLEVQVLGEIENILRLRGCIDCLMEELTPVHREILSLRYEKGLSWIQIGIRLNYDERSARRLETQAVDLIAQRI